MLSRLKKINPDLSASGIALVIAIMSVFIALGSDNAPCLSANATCTVGQNPEFTGDIDIKSDTIYNATIGHNLSANATYSLVQPGYNHTGNLAVIDSANDLNVGGAVVLGTSATSTLGAIRFDSNAVQVYDSTGAWVGVGGTPTDDIGQVTSDSGSFTASSQQDNINIVGGTGISTSVTGDTLTINASGSGTQYANFHLSSDQTLNYSGFGSTSNIDYDTERFDTEDCFSADSSGTITYDSGCNTAFYEVNLTNVISFSGLTNDGAMIQGAINIGSTGFNYRTWVTLYSIPNYTMTTNYIACIDPSDTITVNFFHGSGYSTGSAKWLSGIDESSLSFIKLNEKGSSC
tara:strand:+ start:427 stop:1467 length:1041 start_codon:yes stop_codon:yes gene_type:complete